MKILQGLFITLILYIWNISANKSCNESDAIKLHYMPDFFRVVGKASGVLQAEQVTIGLTVITLDKEAAESLNQNSKIVNNVLTDLKTIGIDGNEFSTSGLQVYPSYIQVYNRTFGNYEQVFEGYKVRNSITINTKKINLAGKIIDKAVQNGVNNIDYITYSPLGQNIVKLREKLLAEAVKNATKQAEIVLDELGYEIKSVKNINIINESQTYNPQPMPKPVPRAPQPERADTQTFSSVDRQEVHVEVSFIIAKVDDG